MEFRRRRRVVWERLDGPGHEEATLFPFKRTWHLRGRIKTVLNGLPARIKYEFACGEDWSFHLALISMRWNQAHVRQALSLDSHRGWSVFGKPRADLGDCQDLDLSVTPSTNTIPIRRLGLEVGESAEVTAAWVRFPELTVEPLPQRYTRLAANRYRYESLGSGFVADLETDSDGLVVSYPGLWARASTLK